jgi:hypothetical protein
LGEIPAKDIQLLTKTRMPERVDQRFSEFQEGRAIGLVKIELVSINLNRNSSIPRQEPGSSLGPWVIGPELQYRFVEPTFPKSLNYSVAGKNSVSIVAFSMTAPGFLD